MLDLKRKIMAVAIGAFVATGVFAQKRGERPPKPPNTVVVVAPKNEKPPPSNNNRGDKKPNDKKGKN